VILNRDPTDFDDVADFAIRADIGAILAPFIGH
jgi:NAD-dependent deacetylase